MVEPLEPLCAGVSAFVCVVGDLYLCDLGVDSGMVRWRGGVESDA